MRYRSNADFQNNGELSPDGHWLAYDSYETGGRLEIVVRPFPEVESGKRQVSSGGGSQSVWARNSRELFYLAPDGALMSVQWDVIGGRFSARPPVKLVEGQRSAADGGLRRYDVTPDGKKFLMIKEGGGESPAAPNLIVVVQNWVEELKRLLPLN